MKCIKSTSFSSFFILIKSSKNSKILGETINDKQSCSANPFNWLPSFE